MIFYLLFIVCVLLITSLKRKKLFPTVCIPKLKPNKTDHESFSHILHSNAERCLWKMYGLCICTCTSTNNTAAFLIVSRFMINLCKLECVKLSFWLCFPMLPSALPFYCIFKMFICMCQNFSQSVHIFTSCLSF